MTITITKVTVTVHPFGMDTIHLHTDYIDPCDKNDTLAISFKAPRGMGFTAVYDLFPNVDVAVERHNFGKDK